MSGSAVTRITGRAIAIEGHDIDTDRIMPARFLKAITFEGLEAHLFEDDRIEAAGRGLVHPFDDTSRAGARVLIVGRNFGCGSSREHAPQAIARWGIRAIVGESFAEIFFGNALMLGLPCVMVDGETRAALAAVSADDPSIEIAVDLEARSVTTGDRSVPITISEPARHALMSGAWDATALLLADYDTVRRTAGRLPYIGGFKDL
ncbi:MAG TPA: 3-isopropylmalate dehydratase small subunit [Vicinamibacterales bacterium]|nr:3-isopropylmalate dehydratase small subunit [Vicinamibacterales bacterium]